MTTTKLPFRVSEHDVRCPCCNSIPPVALSNDDSIAFNAFSDLCKLLDAIRDLNDQLRVHSWYRCPKHPIESSKSIPGTHSTGLAFDVVLSRQAAYHALSDVVKFSDHFGYLPGVGVHPHGALIRVHVDFAASITERFARERPRL